MKAAVIGSRSFNDYNKLSEVLSTFEISEIISGGAKGVDILAERYANSHHISTTILKPDWSPF
jgi:predicted Rossmann fold nucleotide-binding protein DprA/Smf involved in DNA uptake